MEISLKPRHITEMRRVLDEFLLDHGVPDDLLVRGRREREEVSQKDLTLALSGEEEMIVSFDQEAITSLQLTRSQNGGPVVNFKGNDSQTDLWSQELNAIFACIVNDHLPTQEKVVRTLLSDFGKSFQSPSRKRSSMQPLFPTLPAYQVPSPRFYAECYGGGKNRGLTELFTRLSSKRGQIEHTRYKVVYQWGNTLRIDFIEIHLPKEGSAYFLAVNGIITVWHTGKSTSPHDFNRPQQVDQKR